MSRIVTLALLVCLSGCGEDSTGALSPPDPIPWTPSLELAALSLDDPIVADVVESLSDRATAGTVSAHILESRALVEGRRVGAAATQVTSALEALRRNTNANDAIHADVLALVLGDVQERFTRALATSSPSH